MIRADASALANATRFVSSVASKSHSIPAMTGIRIVPRGDAVEISATNMVAVAWADVLADADGDGFVVHPRFVDLVASMSGTISIDQSSGVHVVSGRSSHRLPQFDNYPELPERRHSGIDIDRVSLTNALRHLLVLSLIHI